MNWYKYNPVDKRVGRAGSGHEERRTAHELPTTGADPAKTLKCLMASARLGSSGALPKKPSRSRDNALIETLVQTSNTPDGRWLCEDGESG